MGKLILTIDGYIGSWGYSQQWLKDMLSGHENDEVILNISSLGGQVNHALSMHDQLKEHGNVAVNFTGFVASSGTLIGMGAKTRRMSKNALFLIHKAMSWIDEFGLMNEDDIEGLIQKLEKEKNENAKITLVLANIYHKISQKPVHDVLNLMKEDTWLNSEEVLKWGFVDEEYEPGEGSMNLFEDFAKVAMVTSNGLPDPRNRFDKKLQTISNSSGTTTSPVVNEDNTQNDETQATMKNAETGFVNFINRLTSILTPKNNNQMTKKFININKALGVEELDLSAMTELQAQVIDQALQAGNQAAADIVTARQAQQTAEDALASEQTARTNAETERDTSQNNLDSMVALIDQINPAVASAQGNEAKVAAIRTLLSNKPGASALGALGKDANGNKNDGVDWDTLNSLPHMQEEV